MSNKELDNQRTLLTQQLSKQIGDMRGPTKEAILGEIEELIRVAPVSPDPSKAADQAWIGRMSAALSKWDPLKGYLVVSKHVERLGYDSARQDAIENLMVSLHTARAALRMDIGATLSAVPATGEVFDYFDTIRKVVETARDDILFIDPYLEADFVGRYMPYVAHGVDVRLLTSKMLRTLLPAVEAFSKQHGTSIAVRSATDLHDRYVIVDAANCYQSGASFKDGAKNAPTTLTEITDAFVPVRNMYEAKWAQAKVER